MKLLRLNPNLEIVSEEGIVIYDHPIYEFLFDYLNLDQIT